MFFSILLLTRFYTRLSFLHSCSFSATSRTYKHQQQPHLTVTDFYAGEAWLRIAGASAFPAAKATQVASSGDAALTTSIFGCARLVLHLWLGRWWAWLLLNGPPLGSRNGCRPLPGTSHSHPRSEDGCATIMYFWVKRKTWIPHLIKKVNISKCERVSVKCVPSVLCKHNLVCTKNFS